MSKHTPGPWRVLADEQIMGRPISGRWAVEADGAYICLDPEWDDECYAESVANARLIAAAPELYAACRACADGVTGWQALLHFALQKAEGQPA